MFYFQCTFEYKSHKLKTQNETNGRKSSAAFIEPGQKVLNLSLLLYISEI